MSTASDSSAAARRAAAAGLLSSCASPAAIVPSEASRSRFCSIAVIRLITGATWRITRSCTAGCAKASARKSSRAIRPIRQAVSEVMRTPSEAPVSTATAWIQVGACWRPTSSARPFSTTSASSVALQQQHHALGVVALVADARVGLERALLRDGGERLQGGLVEVVEEVDAAQVLRR